jgi:hypothetical protein
VWILHQQNKLKTTMRRICHRTRKADESSSSLFNFSFTATAKRKAEANIEFEEAEEAGEANSEPVVNTVPLLLHPVPVPQHDMTMNQFQINVAKM